MRDKGGRAYGKDSDLLLGFLADTNVANFYGSGHGYETVDNVGPIEVGLRFLGMKTSDLQRRLERPALSVRIPRRLQHLPHPGSAIRFRRGRD